ncbi:MAG: histidine kinase [Bacteroidetes bacterium]|nr:histidine kinase [Bacteroidota bacterium]
MQKYKLYWVCQIGGWAFFMIIEMISYGNVFGFNQLLVLNVVVNFFLGLGLTHTYRLFLIRTNWLTLTTAKLIPRASISIICISVIMTMMNVFLDRFTVPLLRQFPVDGILIFNYLFNWSRYILMWALIYHLFQYWERSLQAEKDRLQLQATLKDNQYQNLRNQLNPHFLFNSLNSIRTLIDFNPNLSKEAITRLSSLLRSSLQMNNKKTIPLKNELETLEDYLAIEKIRFDDRLLITYDIEQSTTQLEVPPMMLQTLVENSVKHGISNLKNGGFVEIKTFKKNNQLCIEITNSGQFLPKDKNEGLGIKNTEERLQLLYDGKASFNICNINIDTVLTQIKIPNDKDTHY